MRNQQGLDFTEDIGGTVKEPRTLRFGTLLSHYTLCRLSMGSWLLPSKVTPGRRPEDTTVYLRVDHLSRFNGGGIGRLGGGCMTPTPQVESMEASCDKRQIRRTAMGQDVINGLSNLHNSPRLMERGEGSLAFKPVCRFRGSGLTDLRIPIKLPEISITASQVYTVFN